MTLPNFLLGFLIASTYGTVFHIIFDGGAGRLAVYLIAGWIGFWAGHAVGTAAGTPIFNLGPLALGAASLGALALLFTARWLANVRTVKKNETL